MNWAYTREHDAVRVLPPVSPRHPLRAAAALLRSRAWMSAFGTETAGWLVYLAALRLAPLALVQAVSASGIAVLALLAPGDERARREWIGVATSIAGLVLLAVSLIGSHPTGKLPGAVPAVLWLGVLGAAAAVLSVARTRIAAAAMLGLAAGLLFSGGDISAKLVVHGGQWLLSALPLIVFYALGSIQLQGAFQHGAAVSAAGIATLTTNAVPIVAGIVLLDETLPGGVSRALQVASFAMVVGGAALLTDPRARAG